MGLDFGSKGGSVGLKILVAPTVRVNELRVGSLRVRWSAAPPPGFRCPGSEKRTEMKSSYYVTAAKTCGSLPKTERWTCDVLVFIRTGWSSELERDTEADMFMERRKSNYVKTFPVTDSADASCSSVLQAVMNYCTSSVRSFVSLQLAGSCPERNLLSGQNTLTAAWKQLCVSDTFFFCFLNVVRMVSSLLRDKYGPKV